MEYIIALVWSALETLGVFFIWKAFLPQKLTSRIFLLVLALICVLQFVVCNFSIHLFEVSFLLQQCITFLIFLVGSFVVFSGGWQSHLLTTVVSYIAAGIVDSIAIYGVSAALNITYNELIWRKLLYTIVVTTGKCVTLFLSWFICHYRTQRTLQSISGKWLILTLTFPLVSLVMLIIIFDSYRYQHDLSYKAVIFSAVLAIANAAILYLIDDMEKAVRAEHELAILRQSMELQTENIEALEKRYRAQRSATHEFKHQLQVIYGLLEKSENKKACDYVQKLQQAQTARIFAVNTKHSIVDAILNEKYHTAKESNIDIRIKINDLSQLKIGTDSLVVLLSNLLDNAIEACGRLASDRVIECTLLLEDSLFLSIRNTSCPVKIVNGTIATSKEPQHEHGFGLAGVRRVLENLNGEYVINYENGWFQFTADIPIN